jgi:hypothetical protein
MVQVKLKICVPVESLTSINATASGVAAQQPSLSSNLKVNPAGSAGLFEGSTDRIRRMPRFLLFM